VVRRRETRLTFVQQLGCQIALSAVAAAVLHLFLAQQWWPRATVAGIMIGFGVWMLLVDVDWIRSSRPPAGSHVDRSGSWTDWLE
jgi:hypothetical protein